MIAGAGFVKVWKIPGSTGEFYVVRGSEIRTDTRVVTFPPGLRAQLEQWLSDPSSRHTALDMYTAIAGRAEIQGIQSNQPESQHRIKLGLLDAFRRGVLVILPVPRGGLGSDSALVEEEQESTEVDKESAKPALRKTWIEIELRDTKGKPVASERYRIETPDGVFHTGVLDSAGHARLADIDPGECQICFPDIDSHEWYPAQRGG